MKNVLIVIVLVVLAAGGVWYVNAGKTTPPVTESETVTPATESAGTQEASMEGDVKEIVVEGAEFKFNQATLTLAKGEKVRLVFKNMGKMTHDFVVDELNIRTKIIKGGEQDTVEFTPDTTGSFEFYCSVNQHRAMGMKGTITVQ